MANGTPDSWPGTPQQAPQKWPGSPAAVDVSVRPFGTPEPSRQAPPPAQGPISKALEPLTSWPGTYRDIRQESEKQVGEGVSELKQGKVGAGLWDTGFGAMRFVGSPIEAGLQTVVGKPLEENVGIPSSYSTFAAGLALPYYGLTRGGAGKEFNKFFRPEAVGPAGRAAAGAIREAQGVGARSTASSLESVEPFHPLVNAMSPGERQGLVNYMEGVGPAPNNPQAQQLATKLRNIFEERKVKLQNLSSTATMNFIDDYFPHMWKNPQQAQQFANTWSGIAKQGSGASLRARTMPTIEDGLRAGLQPVSDNPIEIMSRYVQSMDRFIASQEVIEAAEANGTVIRAKPKTVGASGHPQSQIGNIPDGYVPLRGRGAVDASGRQAYAPAEWARVYNNFLSRGVHDLNEDVGHAYDVARRGTNAITALELSMSGYHALTMAQEAMVNEVGRAFEQASAGHVVKAARSLAGTPFSPITLPIKGRQAEKVYLGTTQGTQQERELVDLLTRGGARMKGKGHAPDYQNSAAGSYWTAFKRGALSAQLKTDLQTARSGAGPFAGVVLKQVGRTMDTMMQPLFEQYIPKLKNGAAMENMASWLKTHPNASAEEKLAAAREIVDSVDNRFGEMVQDNIFWSQWQKQAAMLAMRSYSWNLGTLREIGGGVKDVLEPKAGGELSRRTAYVIALPMVYGALSAAYQYMKTGEPPKDTHDLIAPRTGGTDPGTGEPERITMPGYMKDVIGWSTDPRQEAANKVATAPRTMYETIFKGSDWRGDPIAEPGNPDASMPENVPTWLKGYFSHVIDAAGPISMKNLAKGPRQGTGISRFEQILGIQPAGMKLTDPEGFSQMMRSIDERKQRAKERHDERDREKYGGTE